MTNLEKARANMRRIKPFDVWLAEAPRSAADIAMYHFVKDGFAQLVALETAASAARAARQVRGYSKKTP